MVRYTLDKEINQKHFCFLSKKKKRKDRVMVSRYLF